MEILRQGSSKLPILEGIKQCKCMANFDGISLCAKIVCMKFGVGKYDDPEKRKEFGATSRAGPFQTSFWGVVFTSKAWEW